MKRPAYKGGDFSKRDKLKLNRAIDRLARKTAARVKVIKVDSLGVEL